MASWDTVWHVRLTAKLLQVISCRLLVQFVQKMITNQSLILQVGEKIICLKCLNGLPQGSVLAPLLVNTHTSDLPEMQAKKHVHTHDICIADTGNGLYRTEGNLSQGVDILTPDFQQ